MRNQESSAQNHESRVEKKTVLHLTDNLAQIAFARKWFKLHPEIAKEIELHPEHPSVTGNDILKAWVEHAATAYRNYLNYSENTERMVNIDDEDEISEVLRDMGILKTIH